MPYPQQQITRLSQVSALWLLAILMNLPVHGVEVSVDGERNSAATPFSFSATRGPYSVGLKVVPRCGVAAHVV